MAHSVSFSHPEDAISAAEEFEITIYKRPVQILVVIRGKARFLREQNFLDQCLGRIPVSIDGRRQPDANYYILEEDQLIAYQAFRRQMGVAFGKPD